MDDYEDIPETDLTSLLTIISSLSIWEMEYLLGYLTAKHIDSAITGLGVLMSTPQFGR